MTPHTEHSIIISPIGDFDSEILKSLGTGINLIFGYKTEIISLLKDVEFSLDHNRHQYHSTVILEKLAALAPPHAVKIVAITEKDLYIPILTYVYGEAQLGGTACIISTHRLKDGLSPVGTKIIYHGRIVKEAVHELGHTFKLRHCPDHACIMHYCRSINDVDTKTDDLCRYCKIMLADELKVLGIENNSNLG